MDDDTRRQFKVIDEPPNEQPYEPRVRNRAGALVGFTVPAEGYSGTIIREGREAARRKVEMGGNARWCVMSEGFVWSLHRTEAAAVRAADKLDREYGDITGGNPPLLCRGAEEGDSYDDLDVVREGC
jgi:hypothetical protein